MRMRIARHVVGPSCQPVPRPNPTAASRFASHNVVGEGRALHDGIAGRYATCSSGGGWHALCSVGGGFMLCMLEVLKGMRHIQMVVDGMLCVLHAVESVLCMLEVPEGMPHIQMVVDCMLYVLEVLEAARCVLLCMPEAVDGVMRLLEVPEVIRCMRLVCWRPWRAYATCWSCRR